MNLDIELFKTFSGKIPAPISNIYSLKWIRVNELVKRTSETDMTQVYGQAIEIISDTFISLGGNEFTEQLVSYLMGIVENYIVPYEVPDIRLKLLWICLAVSLKTKNITVAQYLMACLDSDLEKVISYNDTNNNNLLTITMNDPKLFTLLLESLNEQSITQLLTTHSIFEKISFNENVLLIELMQLYPNIVKKYTRQIGGTVFNLLDYAIIENNLTAIDCMIKLGIITDSMVNRDTTVNILLTYSPPKHFSKIIDQLAGNVALDSKIFSTHLSETYAMVGKDKLQKIFEIFSNHLSADIFYKIMIVAYNPSLLSTILNTNFATKDRMFEKIGDDYLIVKLCRDSMCIEFILNLCDSGTITSHDLFIETDVGKQLLDVLISSSRSLMFTKYFVSKYKKHIKLTKCIIDQIKLQKTDKSFNNILFGLDFDDDLFGSSYVFKILFELLEPKQVCDIVTKYYAQLSTIDNIICLVELEFEYVQIFKVLIAKYLTTYADDLEKIINIMDQILLKSKHSSYKRLLINISSELFDTNSDLFLRLDIKTLLNSSLNSSDKFIILTKFATKYPNHSIFPLEYIHVKNLIISYFEIDENLDELFLHLIAKKLINSACSTEIFTLLFSDETVSIKLFALFLQSQLLTKEIFINNYEKTINNKERFELILSNPYCTVDLFDKISSNGNTVLMNLLLNKNSCIEKILKWISYETFVYKNQLNQTCFDCIVDYKLQARDIIHLLESVHMCKELIPNNFITNIIKNIDIEFKKIIQIMLNKKLFTKEMFTMNSKNKNILTKLAELTEDDLIYEISWEFPDLNIYECIDNNENNCLDILLKNDEIIKHPIRILLCYGMSEQVLLKTNVSKLVNNKKNLKDIAPYITEKVLLKQQNGVSLIRHIIKTENTVLLIQILNKFDPSPKDILIRENTLSLEHMWTLLSFEDMWTLLSFEDIECLRKYGYLDDIVATNITKNVPINVLTEKHFIIALRSMIQCDIKCFNKKIIELMTWKNSENIDILANVLNEIDDKYFVDQTIITNSLNALHSFKLICDKLLTNHKMELKTILNDIVIKNTNLSNSEMYKVIDYLISRQLYDVEILSSMSGTLVEKYVLNKEQECSADELVSSGLISKHILKKIGSFNQTILHKLSKNKKVISFAISNKLFETSTLIHRDIYGKTLLDDVIENKNNVDEIVDILIDSNIYEIFENKDRHGNNIFMKLIKNKYLEKIEKILTKMVHLINQIDSDGNICINYVLDNSQLLDLLLKYIGETIFTINNDGLNCLMYAIKHKKEQLLLSKLSIDQINKLAYFDDASGSILTIACQYNSASISHILKITNDKLLNITCNGLTFFQIACKYNLSAIKELLSETHKLKINIEKYVIEFTTQNHSKINGLILATLYQPEAIDVLLNSNYGSTAFVENVRLISGTSIMELALKYQPLSIKYLYKHEYCKNEIKCLLTIGRSLEAHIKRSFGTYENFIENKLNKIYNIPIDSTEQHSCSICCSYKVQILFQPCEHVVCVGCSSNLTNCPHCRGAISARIALTHLIDS